MASKLHINLGGVAIGGGAPISIQTMTNTKTEDVDATVAQICQVESAGCDIVRVSCNTKAAAESLGKIISRVSIPVVADIHFHYKLAIISIENGAHCVRINPGNMDESGFREIVRCAEEHGIPIRIGVNSGSLEREILDKYHEPNSDALVESAMLNEKKMYDFGYPNFKISIKSSDVKTCIDANRKLSCSSEHPIHVGLTESGPVFSGTIKSSACLGALLCDGVGDTIRVSLSGDPVEEVKVGRQILKAFNLLDKSVNIISCPTCSRTVINVIELSKNIEDKYGNLQKKVNISMLGCVVNGIGEAEHSDIGIFGIKQGVAKIYFKGKEYLSTCEEKDIMTVVDELILDV